MKKYLLITLLFTSLLSFAQYDFKGEWIEIPKELSSHASVVVREYNTTYTINSLSNLEEEVYKVITVLDNEGKEYATQVWYYNLFSKFTSGEIQLYDKNGEFIDKIRLKDMEDIKINSSMTFADDSRYKVYEPQIKETPYTMVIKYEKKFNDFFFVSRWYPQTSSNISVQNAKLSIYNPGNIGYKIKMENIDSTQLEILNPGPFISWKAKNLKAFTPEPYTKSTQLPYIYIVPEKFQVDGFAGSTKSWKHFGLWTTSLLEGRDVLPEETQQQIRELVQDISDPKEKAQAIYAWMQNNTHYISIQSGIGGWQPQSATEVDENKYGDCKGLVNYTKALLKAANIKSFYTRVYASSSDNDFDTTFPSNQFNHIILCIPFENDTCWAECTANNYALGYLGDFTDDRYALLVNGRNSKLVKTPAYPKEQNKQIRSGKITINPDGSANAILETSFQGLQSDFRLGQVNEDLQDQKDFLYKRLDISSFTLDSIHYNYQKEINPIIDECLKLSIPKYANTTSSRMFVGLNLLNKHTHKPDIDTARKHPIYIKLAYTDVDSLVYTLPKGYKVERIPQGKTYKTIFGTYQSEITFDDEKIIYVRKVEQNSGTFPANKWSDYRKYRTNIVKADKATLILKKAVN